MFYILQKNDGDKKIILGKQMVLQDYNSASLVAPDCGSDFLILERENPNSSDDTEKFRQCSR